ncbi:hypothetical protein LCGC14_0305710 [marine sediment metagenome]|uniref:RecF/RecN/SMC N-terminal domain-containing protein n=1 Tax=marine sediment metagenome TaxID=412755 RepID=A0A0F9U620_9ZZZZ
MIKKLKIKEFCQHKDVELNLTEGINILLGKNTIGKTNLLESISFAAYSKTNHSTLDKVINYDADSASVELTHQDFTAKRTRTKGISKLSKIKKSDLLNKLNVEYQEYLRIFYISVHESSKLFDASYLKKFLIALFKIEKYTKTYERLRIELNTLKSIQPPKKINRVLLTNRFNRVRDIVAKFKEKRVSAEKEGYKYYTVREQINLAKGKLASAKDEYSRKVKRIKWDKCYTCDRPITAKEKEPAIKELKSQKPKLLAADKLITEKYNKLRILIDKHSTKLGVLDNRISKGRIILATIKEKLSERQETPNINRIKELQKIIPVFSNNGFPAYLLQAYTPVIQETANSLIQLIFKDLSIKIRTYRPNSNIPDFKVMIYRNGIEVGTLDDLSGAERVLVNLCLRLGVIVIYKQLHNTCIDWLLVDEGLEKLDTENSLKIIHLFKNFIKLGYLKQIAIVSHKECLKNLEDINYVKIGGTDDS